MTFPNFENKKLGGTGFIVQIDETMVKFKCKNHRERLHQTKAMRYVLSKGKIKLQDVSPLFY
ncbi:hypothetical protein H312_00483 [Anncaliia algerae PRA339]|uniref:Uncharacterized protein n=1 Tax=Anncaliia algerae PRA339 TaxID=1288291 RepID=A0A059F4W7_9MICR|nr:hypothetical protein H312_00483 [Anncaliia algerae PRA339]